MNAQFNDTDVTISNCDGFLFVDYGYLQIDKSLIINQSYELGQTCFDSCLKPSLSIDLNIDLNIDEIDMSDNTTLLSNITENSIIENSFNYSLITSMSVEANTL